MPSTLQQLPRAEGSDRAIPAYPNTGLASTTTSRTHDGVGRLTGIDNNTHSELDFTYTYDSIGNIASETRGGSMSGSSWTAGYDDEQRLTTWDVSTGNDEAWTLSEVGNWDVYTVGTLAQTFNHGDAHELNGITGTPGPTAPPAGTLTYDNRGNMTQDTGGLTYAWDNHGMLASVTVPSGSTVGIEGTHTYEYDVLGRRVAKVVNDTVGSTATKTIYAQRLVTLPPLGNLGGQVVAEYESVNGSTPALTRRYAYGDYVDEPVWMGHTDGTTTTEVFLHQDRRYNVIGVTANTATTLLATGDYTAYGKGGITLTTAGTSAGTPTVPYGFTGRRHDGESGLIYCRARTLHAKLGGFLSRDEYLHLFDMSRYVFPNNPSFADPSGNNWVQVVRWVIVAGTWVLKKVWQWVVKSRQKKCGRHLKNCISGIPVTVAMCMAIATENGQNAAQLRKCSQEATLRAQRNCKAQALNCAKTGRWNGKVGGSPCPGSCFCNGWDNDGPSRSPKGPPKIPRNAPQGSPMAA